MIVLHHAEHFAASDKPVKGGRKVGVLTNSDDVELTVYRVRHEGGTTVLNGLPDLNDSRGLADMCQAVVERHSDRVTGVSGDDPRMVAKVAALLGADVVEA